MQIVAAIAISSVFTCAHIKFQPFEEDLDDSLQTCSLLSTVLTYWGCALLLASNLDVQNDPDPKVGIFMVMVNVAVLAFALYAMFYDTIPSVIDDYRTKYEKIQRLMEKERAEKGAAQKTAVHLATLESGQELLTTDDNKKSPDAIETSKMLLPVYHEVPGQKRDQEITNDQLITAGDNRKQSEEELQSQFIRKKAAKCIQNLFGQYDLDESGFIGSSDAFFQLCLNICIKLKLKLKVRDLEVLSEKVDLDKAPMNVHKFTQWFTETFEVC